MFSYRRITAVLLLSILVQSQAQAWWNPFSSDSLQNSIQSLRDSIQRNPFKSTAIGLAGLAVLCGGAYGLYDYFSRNAREADLPVPGAAGDFVQVSNEYFRVTWPWGSEHSRSSRKTNLLIAPRNIADVRDLNVDDDDQRALWIELLRRIKYFEHRLEGAPQYRISIDRLGTTFDANNLLGNRVKTCPTMASSSSSSSSSAQSDEETTECVFCNPTTEVVYQDDVVRVIKKMRPAGAPYKTELLVIPIMHIQDIVKLDVNNDDHQTVWAHLLRAINNLKQQLNGDQQFVLEINGPGFNGVPHLHMHFKSENGLKISSLAEDGGASSSSASSSSASSSSASSSSSSSGVEDKAEKITCVQCGAEDNLKKCSQCQAVQYCSRECQVAGWPRHKSACKKLKRSIVGVDKFFLSDYWSQKIQKALKGLISDYDDLKLEERSDSVLELSVTDFTFNAFIGIKNINVNIAVVYVLSFEANNNQWQRFASFDTIDDAVNFMRDSFGDKFSLEIQNDLRRRYQKVKAEIDNLDKMIHERVGDVMQSMLFGGASASSSSSQSQNVCSKCQQPASDRCAGCKKVYYCSRGCQTSDWKKHKASCQK